MKTDKERLDRLDKLRVPFNANQINKLPAQAGWMKDKKNEYTGCTICGGWHHPKATHLDYVGHAALTDRLLDVDPEWNWEPLSINEMGLPVMDQIGGMWIKLTICGVTRLGYGSPDGKKGGNAIKEIIGDALRNAGMRFGLALDLWHKGELHADSQAKTETTKKAKPMSYAEAKRILGDTANTIFGHYQNNDSLGIKEVLGEMDGKHKQAVKKLYTHKDNNIFDEIIKLYEAV